MSLFQCQQCGCCENTALAGQGCNGHAEKLFDWSGIEDRRGKKLCSACAPTKYSDGKNTRYGQWHGRFPRVFLPMGMFRTNTNGNLAHVETGDEDYRKYAIGGAPAYRHCQSQHPDKDVCRAAQRDGVLCADGECDIDEGVRATDCKGDRNGA